MRKTIKIFSIIIIVLSILCTITTTFVYAQDLLPDPGKYAPPDESAPQNVTNMIGTIATIIQAIGVVLSVIVIVLLGIKYMLGSVEERADYKKAMLPFLVGAVLITATSTIVKIINDLTSQTITE